MIWVQDDEDETRNDKTRSSEAHKSEKTDWERYLILIFDFDFE